MPQLLVDCLIDIFEYFVDHKITLLSCLFVNRLWCEVSVRILWRSIRNYSTLIACLPNESKEILNKNGIIILTSKPPIFNYASFCKVFSFNQINDKIDKFLEKISRAFFYLKYYTIMTV